MPKRIAVLAILLLTACRPDPGEVCSGEGCGGGEVTDVTVKPAAPPKVTGARASRVNNGVRVTWKTASGALGYEVYREEAVIPNAPLLAASLHTFARTPYAVAARVPGSRIGSATKTELIDTSAEEGYEYTYRVVAFNKIGDAPPSDPAQIRLFPVGPVGNWVDDWLQAPANSGPVGGGSDWSNPLGTAGGNSGVTAVTEFPGAGAAYASCSASGGEATAIRPAVDTLLASAPQTFTLDFVYNTGGVSGWTYGVIAMGYDSSPGTPIYRETGALTGCGAKSVSFTADIASVYEDRITLWVFVFDEWEDAVYFDSVYYYRLDGEWIRVNATTPAQGALLTGGVLDIELEFHNAASQNVRASLMPPSAWGVRFGEVVTTIAGSGTATLSLPYNIICGHSEAVLEIDTAAPFLSAPYEYPVTTSDVYQFRLNSAAWLRPGSRYFQTDLFAVACNGAENVTITAPLGWRVGYFDPDIYQYEWNQTVTARSGSQFALQADDDFLAALPFGSAVSTVTAQFTGATITAPATVNVYGLFWQTEPPDTATAGLEYAVAVTVLGPRPADVITAYVPPKEVPLAWDATAQAYTANLVYPTCGNFSNAISDGRRYSRSYLGGTYYSNPFATYVETAANVNAYLWDDYIYFYADWPEAYDVYLFDRCQNPFTWQVVGAPAWVRFEALTGTQDDPVRSALLASAAFTSSYYAYGVIEILILESNQKLYIDVNAYKD